MFALMAKAGNCPLVKLLSTGKLVGTATRRMLCRDPLKLFPVKEIVTENEPFDKGVPLTIPEESHVNYLGRPLNENLGVGSPVT